MVQKACETDWDRSNARSFVVLVNGSGIDAVVAATSDNPDSFAGGGPAVLHALLLPWWGKRGEICPEDGVWGIPELRAGDA